MTIESVLSYATKLTSKNTILLKAYSYAHRYDFPFEFG